MNSEKLSPRQLSAAVMTGGLSAGAAFAGLADWRWLLACVPVGVLAGWLLLRRVERRPMRPVLQVLYGAWGAVLLAGVLERAAGRVQPAAGGRGSTVWLLVLLALPLFWMGWGKGAAFFRAVEILWLAAGDGGGGAAAGPAEGGLAVGGRACRGMGAVAVGGVGHPVRGAVRFAISI